MRTRVPWAIGVVVAMGSVAAACRGRDDRSSRYGPEPAYEGVATAASAIGGGPPATSESAPLTMGLTSPASASAPSSCAMPPPVHRAPMTPTSTTIPPRPIPGHRPQG